MLNSTSTRDVQASSAGAACNPEAIVPFWSKVSRKLRLGFTQGEASTFEHVLEPTVLRHLEGRGLKQFVQLPWLTAGVDMHIEELWEFVTNQNSVTTVYGEKLSLTKVLS